MPDTSSSGDYIRTTSGTGYAIFEGLNVKNSLLYIEAVDIEERYCGSVVDFEVFTSWDKNTMR